MIWFWLFELVPISMMSYSLYQIFFVIRRHYGVGQVIWFKHPEEGEWVLAVVARGTEYPNVNWVRPLDENKLHCTSSHDRRPIHWWQRNKVDPIIMRHVLLEGELI